MAYILGVIVASTRPGRAGTPVAKWVMEQLGSYPAFEARLIELGEVNLPMMDEPHHPRLQKYTQEHTKAWSAIVRPLDAVIVVTPEYNYACPPALINAFDCLFHEWAYKPLAFVSYGGISGGLRSVQMSKLIACTLRMVPIPEGLPIPFFVHHLKDGVFTGTDVHAKSFGDMMPELTRLTEALGPLRDAKRTA